MMMMMYHQDYKWYQIFVVLGHHKKLRVSTRIKMGGDTEQLGSAPRRRVDWAIRRCCVIRQRGWLLPVDAVDAAMLGSCGGVGENSL
ncbi:unnamed protein product [Prunus armeniaca]|uniref:Uncharacterized protein n=1 Tax=Prunus armeniaca TaxID=36596 RepID=A0A6J5WVA1_PRUAR|nr:unnamed protein product [Prunus armeniaca]CAB4303957.1 unnamed protein product [Prunus armeniaca]